MSFFLLFFCSLILLYSKGPNNAEMLVVIPFFLIVWVQLLELLCYFDRDSPCFLRRNRGMSHIDQIRASPIQRMRSIVWQIAWSDFTMATKPECQSFQLLCLRHLSVLSQKQKFIQTHQDITETKQLLSLASTKENVIDVFSKMYSSARNEWLSMLWLRKAFSFLKKSQISNY